MKNSLLNRLFGLCFFLLSSTVFAQDVSSTDLSKIRVDELSDAQISVYWQRAQDEGYTLGQLETIAKAQGMPSSEISKLRSRINNLGVQKLPKEDLLNDTIVNSELLDFGLSPVEKPEIPTVSNPIYGMDFFQNPNISFTPNLNVATPDSYQLGPGDEILIDVWGASEASYVEKISSNGAIRIERLGPIYLSGLTVRKARAKVISYFKKIYAGIDAKPNSPTKTFVELSLTQARSVQVNIIGEIQVPGTYTISSMSTVINALFAAGGPNELGSFREIKLVRGGKVIAEIDIYDYLKNGVLSESETLRDQDVIVVPAYSNQVRVYGETKRPGIYELKSGETIKELMFYASGFTAEANQKHIAVERYNGKDRELLDLDYTLENNLELIDGDYISIARVVDRFTNKVSISGAIYSPGNFEFSEGMDLKDLIARAGGLRDFASLERGLIHRQLNDIEQTIIAFNVSDVLAGTSVVSLEAGDEIEIFDRTAIREEYTVSIDGAVNLDSTYVFEENMTVKDLILIAGGYKDGADRDYVDIFRESNDGNPAVISVNIKDQMQEELTILKPFDRVSVRYVAGFTPLKNVAISGEVSHPGQYSLESRTERISDLIDKSGGLLPSAYSDGITIVRNIDEFAKKTQLAELKKVVEKDSLVDETVIENTFRIGVDYQKLLQNGKGSKYDIVLEEGDVVIVPSTKTTVQITGAVMNSSLKRYEKGASLKYYINGAGGFGDRAKKSKTYVIYANGSVKGTRSIFGFKSYPKVEPGSIIVVPEKPERKGMSAAEIIGITSAVTSMGILIQNAIQN